MNPEIFIVLSIILLKYIKNIGISPIFNIFTVFYCFAFRTIDVFVMTSLRLTTHSALFILFPQKISNSLMANCPAMVAVRNDP